MSKKKITLEVCANSVESALAAQSGGAIRVEFCDNLAEGGTTSSPAQIQLARKLLNIRLYVIIRPRGGDFLYSDIEFEVMKNDIRFCGESGCDGVVIGMLNPDGSIDTNRCAELVQVARNFGMGVTFHRAFDRCNDLFRALEEIITLGCERILTSGGKNSAPEGADVIHRLINQAAGRISIMPGAGITIENIAGLVRNTNLEEFHGTFRSQYPSKMKYFNQAMNNQQEENGLLLTDANLVKEVIRIANNI